MSRQLRLLVVAIAALFVLGFAGCSSATPAAAPPSTFGSVTAITPVAGEVAVPVPTVLNNDYIPSGVNLSDCLNSLERPNCGSPNKGDMQTYLTLLAMIIGLSVIFWRIAHGLRRREATEKVHTGNTF
ncbi:MAG: hypothetical protein ABIQ39_10540 [Ilumatobacteraceae bacterium]